MLLSLLAVLGGLVLLVWSADRFVEGAASTARHYGMPPLLIGMVIVGFGTSAPEMMVSALASMQGNPGIALGNAYGSNIVNIALILGLTALLKPITVHSQVLRKELPILCGVTLLAVWQLQDLLVSRLDALVLFLVFTGLVGLSIRQAMRNPADALGDEIEQELQHQRMPQQRALFWLVVGLLLLIASSRLLVWGAINIAQAIGVSDLLIGLTIVAVGTSLPELASSLIAVKRNEHDIALGNVIGSNFFNTLAVVSIAGAINPVTASPEVFERDIAVMTALTFGLFVMSYGFRGAARLNRAEGAFLLACYIAYTGWLAHTAMG